MKKYPSLLGVNIDHVATIRQARGTSYPDIPTAAQLAEAGGADGITIHLREDRRHIQDRDLELLGDCVQTRINLEMAATQEMLGIAIACQPTYCCIVPERREELTTEGGLDAASQIDRLRDFCSALGEAGILVSLFIDPEPSQIEAAAEIGADIIELHTGAYANATTQGAAQALLKQTIAAAKIGDQLGLQINAGHGLHYENVGAVAEIAEMQELNIGHSIVARALFVGLKTAVREMKTLIVEAQQ